MDQNTTFLLRYCPTKVFLFVDYRVTLYLRPHFKEQDKALDIHIFEVKKSGLDFLALLVFPSLSTPLEYFQVFLETILVARPT